MTPEEMSLNPTRSIFSLFGNICNDPNIFKDPNIVLGGRDFTTEFHKVVFSAINNIAYTNNEIQNITPIDLDNYLANYPTYYKIWDENNGLKYIEDAKQMSNKEVFLSDYEKIKKFSLLRNYVEQGIDVSDIYAYKSVSLQDTTKSNEKLDEMSINEIIEHFTSKIISIRDDWNIEDGTVKDFKAGKDIETLLDRIKENPDMGFPFNNLMYNTLFRGMRKSKFLLRSGATGTGKTRQAIADMCSIACSEKYVSGIGWVSMGPVFPALFISTEIDQEEIQLIMLAFLSGIPDSEIKDGYYDKATKERLDKATEILSKAPLFISYIEDFSISDIEMKIEQYIISENIQYAAFDYIQITPKLSKTMQANFSSHLREDQILVHFSAALKNIATRYNIFLISSTQLNRGSKDIENRDSSGLRGGSATADKVDHGVISYTVSKQDKSNLKHILQRGFQNREPNMAHWVYKNRSGMDHIVVWTYMDLGNVREEVLFTTDYDYNLLEMQGTEIEFEIVDEDENKEDIVF